jgi:hypothetical protein
MGRLLFVLPSVGAGDAVRIDTASGSDTPADIVPAGGGPSITGAALHAGVEGQLPRILGPADATSTLYLKQLDYRGTVTGDPVALTGQDLDAAPDAPGGSSTPGAMRCIAVDFAFDSPGIQDPAAGFVVYTPAVGEVILDDVKFTAVQIITAFDGTTPQLDAGVQSAGAWVGSGNWLDPTFADNAPTGTVASVGNGIGFTNGRIDVQTGTDALAIRLSDGSGNASGSTVGAGRIYLFVAVPTNPT